MWIAPLLLVAAHATPIPLDRARRVFDEIRLASEEEDGRLWSVPLDGPLLLVDRETRHVVANRPDASGLLQPKDGVFVGTLPPTVVIANTAVQWSGVRWTMVMWNAVGERAVSRRRLLFHEIFHRIQDELGLPMAPAENPHLDTLDGRYWLRLELRALAAALRAGPDPAPREPRDPTTTRRDAIADAAAFRARRRALFPGAEASERALENNEGLAEYTGFALRGTTDEETRLAVARTRLDDAGAGGTLVRSFAYATGPAWGLLLDELAPGWRRPYAATDDLALRAVAAANVPLPADVDARAAAYDGARLRAEEERRDHDQKQRVAAYRARLVDGPVLEIPTAIAAFGFDPNTVVPLGEWGNVHPHLTVTGDWGELATEEGARVKADWSAVVFAATDRVRLKLADGWELRPGPRPGDLVLSRAAPQE